MRGCEVKKAQAASQDTERGKPLAAAQQATTREFPAVGDEPEADEPEEDVFKEIPTVANRANPTAGGSGTGDAAAPAAPPEGAGAYRILRPETTDVVDTPAPTKADPSASKRMVLGTTRKPK